MKFILVILILCGFGYYGQVNKVVKVKQVRLKKMPVAIKQENKKKDKNKSDKATINT